MKDVLNRLVEEYSDVRYLSSDPLELVHRHPARTAQDREVVALLCALFAYGRVNSIRSFLKQLLERLGDSPATELVRFASGARELSARSLPYYRFQSQADIRAILLRLGKMIADGRAQGSGGGNAIENSNDDGNGRGNSIRSGIGIGSGSGSGSVSVSGNGHGNATERSECAGNLASGGIAPSLPLESNFGSSHWDTERRIAFFQSRFLSGIPAQDRSPGLLHWIGQAEGNGARKRLCMYLRWMVRKSYPDLGLYHSFSPASLIVPLDVHMGRIGQNLGLTSRKSQDWKMAAQISAGLARLDPNDPLKYDFALTRPGILGKCSGAYQKDVCPRCPLRSICAQNAS